ncbi:anthranilate phosphoribosyltransferase [Brooklawnia cerclae]|uniref:Anthranilate phosphoribosyltransferase n=1 Tax=Brooklawnia cerclae TaxID=349934 RepID=A0ABX0SGP2_9ACTN|nr:anthranilate phosphoribosyltransferase [Brooklawnia cerclae]NIH57558.1 anthranilate phosphoribosyltransferase [Brooklawnia cerclae]
MDFTWPNVLTSLVRGDDMDAQTAQWAMDEILSGNASPVRMAAFMVALRAKGETVGEIQALADGMLAKATPIELPREAVDVVGSGGDRANTVNISTMSAIVAAAAGAKVIKHGNRAASSMSGTADCLEALGVALDVPPAAQAAVLAECGLVFLFAPMYHGSLKHTGPARKELGIQTTFNFLGPLANPARPDANAIGVANLQLADLVAGVLARRGSRGMVFHGEDGLDELTTTTRSDIWLISGGEVERTDLDPAELGLQPATLPDLVGGPPAENAQVARDVFAGKRGPVRDIVLINSAAALLAFDGPQLGVRVADQLRDKVDRAARAIDSGAATELLSRWVDSTQRAAGHR